jgi:hypothetical protein
VTKGSEAQNWQALRISHSAAYYQTILLEDRSLSKHLKTSCSKLSIILIPGLHRKLHAVLTSDSVNLRALVDTCQGFKLAEWTDDKHE